MIHINLTVLFCELQCFTISIYLKKILDSKLGQIYTYV